MSLSYLQHAALLTQQVGLAGHAEQSLALDVPVESLATRAAAQIIRAAAATRIYFFILFLQIRINAIVCVLSSRSRFRRMKLIRGIVFGRAKLFFTNHK